MIFRDLNDTENEKPQRTFLQTDEKRKFRQILYSRSDDEKQAISFYPYRRPPVGKIWTIESVNQCTLLHHIEEISGGNNCIYYFASGLTYFLYRVEDEDLAYLT